MNERILIETQQALNCLTVGILFLDDRDRVFRVFAEDVPGPAAESIREGQPYSVGILSRALRTDKPQFVEDTHYDPDFSSFRNWALNQPMSDATRNYLQAIRSDVTIPLGDIGGYKMFLELIYDQPREFDRGYREFVMHVASRVSIALRRSQHMATLEARAFLYQRLADVGLLAKGFAHEMRGPLNVITNEVFQAEGTIKGLAGSDDELVKIQRNFGSIKGSVVQAEDVIFSLHRLSANGAELGLTDCNDIILTVDA